MARGKKSKSKRKSRNVKTAPEKKDVKDAELYKKIKSSGKYVISVLFGAIIVIFFLPQMAQYITFLDSWSPTIHDSFPKPNSQVEKIDNITFIVKDVGSGVDLESTSVDVWGSVSGAIDGEWDRIDEETIVFKPSIELGPDIYTISINPADRNGNKLVVPYSFVIFVTENPSAVLDFRQNIYPEPALKDIFGERYKPGLESYTILISTENNEIYSLEDFKLALELPHPVVGVIQQGAITLGGFGCTPLTDFQVYDSEKGMVASAGRLSNAPSCKISIYREKLSPNSCGFIDIFVDTNSSANWACNDKSLYSLTYYWNEYGIRKSNTTADTIIASGPETPSP